MDPTVMGPEAWNQIWRSLTSLVLFVGLVVNTVMSFLLAHAIIPSLAFTGPLPPAVRTLRLVLYPIFAASLLLALLALGRGLYLAVDVLQRIYPRFAI